MDSTELLEVATAAARSAAPLLLDRFGSEQALRTKSSATDPVSEADLAAEAAIRAVLAELVPDDEIVGEEGGATAGTSGRRWLVDPIDGTTNYLYGIPQWCISVACDGQAGVVFDPVRDELFAARADGPATLNGDPLAPERAEDLERALVATGFGYEAAVRAEQGRVVAAVLPRVRDIRRGGSAALDLAWLAAGRFDAYYERGIKEWDVAAGSLICARAGLDVHELPATNDLPSGILVCTSPIGSKLLPLLV
jgi:myo-inositol-1(or 4)-monophosphatase